MGLIAEDVVLLTLDDATGRPVRGLRRRGKRDVLIGGALLAELALNGSVDVRRAFFGLSAKLRPVTAGAPADALLQRAFITVGEKPRHPRALVGRIGHQRFDYLAGVLVGRGVLRREQRRRSLTTTAVWPVLDARSKQAVRDQIASVLLRDARPDERTGTLIALLSAVDQAHRLFVSPSVSPRIVKRRAKQIARADWASDAVRNAIIATRHGVEFGGDFGAFGNGDGGGGGD